MAKISKEIKTSESVRRKPGRHIGKVISEAERNFCSSLVRILKKVLL